MVLSAVSGFALAGMLSGCAGAGFGDFSRSTGGDLSSGYNGSLAGNGRGTQNGTTAGLGRGTFAMISTSFKLSSVPGDPFDYEKVNVQVTLREANNSTVDVPAFYDGDNTWRMRFTPVAPGTYAVAGVKLNGQPAHETALDKKDWIVTGDTQPGFVRLDRGDHTRFVFDNGGRYYPIGHNQAWRSDGLPDTPDLFVKMHDAGENWSRVWMTYWDGKNLDWPQPAPVKPAAVKTDDKTNAQASDKTKDAPASDARVAKDSSGAADKSAAAATVAAAPAPVKLGDIDLNAAKKWDAIVAGAEKNGIYFQMVLQHHGQYASKDGFKNSSGVNPNWEENPYNVKNGGFLKSPDEFFTNPQARALTKRKLYYIMSRWGYSPSILAYELFNEVQFTDAGKGKLDDQIALWHREMALFLRQFDGYRHLITTSSANAIALNSPVWETVDYIQVHTYPSDVLSALGATETPATYGAKPAKKADKGSFVGEYGPASLTDEDGSALHQGLWASLMRNSTGAAQYWDWVNVEQHNLYGHFKAATGFVTASGLAAHGSLVPTTLQVDCPTMTTLRFGPGGGFGKATQDEFVVGKEGAPQGMDQYPTFLQGSNHRDMMPKPLTLHVSYAKPGTFALSIAQVARLGAHLKISVDGKPTEKTYAGADADYTPKTDQQTTQIEVGAGRARHHD